MIEYRCRFGNEPVVFRNIARDQRRAGSWRHERLDCRRGAPLARHFPELLFHGVYRRSESSQHSDAVTGVECCLEHRLIGLQDRQRQSPRRSVDGVAKGRTCKQNRIRASPGRVGGKRHNPLRQLGSEAASRLTIGGQRVVEKVCPSRLGPQILECILDRRDGSLDGVHQCDLRHLTLTYTISRSPRYCVVCLPSKSSPKTEWSSSTCCSPNARVGEPRRSRKSFAVSSSSSIA